MGARSGGAAPRRRAGIPGPAARAHRARRRAASLRASASPRARPRLPERVPTPPAWPGSRHPLPRPWNRSPSPLSARLSLSVPPRGGPACRAGLCQPGRHRAGPRQPLPRPQRVRPGLTLGKAQRGRGLRLDRRRAPPDGVATVTGWHAKQFAVPTRLRVSPADPESRFGAEGAARKVSSDGERAGATRLPVGGGRVRYWDSFSSRCRGHPDPHPHSHVCLGPRIRL